MKQMKMFRLLALALLVLAAAGACTTEQVLKTAGKVLTAPLTEGDVANGLKEALVQGISKGVQVASKTDGYNGNSLLRIPFPPEAEKVANTLTKLGFGGEVDKFVTTLNRGAEDAAAEAKPIFIQAIKSMTVQDAFGILKGDKQAATAYLRRTTEQQLFAAFKPKVEASLNKVNATKYYGELVTRYNNLPTTMNKANPNLTDYATQRAIDGLFKLVSQEEQNIRANVSARATELMRRVFAEQD
jgi:hypothetical protein